MEKRPEKIRLLPNPPAVDLGPSTGGSGQHFTIKPPNSMTPMKSLIPVLSALFLGLFTSAEAAVTVTDLTEAEYLNLVSTNTTAWVARFQAGGTSGQASHELSLSANTVVTGEHVWNYPEQIQVRHDAAGNLYATAGLNTVAGQPILSFDTILVKVYDIGNYWDGATFAGGSVSIPNGDSKTIRNMFASEDVDFLRIDLNENSPEFTIEGQIALYGIGDTSHVEFTGINVPEPSTFIFSCIALAACLFNRNRIS